MGRFKEIIIEAAAPYERGVQYGEQAREEITLCIERYKEHFAAMGRMSWEEARSRVTPIRQLLLKDYQDCLAEVEGIAKGSDTDFVDLDRTGEWEVTSTSQMQEYNGITYEFKVYTRRQGL